MKKMRQVLTASILTFALVIAMLPGMRANAANVVRQVGIKPTSITVKWTPPKMSSGQKLIAYRLYAGKDSSSSKLVRKLSPKTTSYTFKKLKPGATKYVKVSYDYSTEYGSYTDYWMGSLYDAKTIPGAVTGLKQDRWYYFIKEVNVTWNGKTSADGYQYLFSRYDGKGKRTGKIESTYATKLSQSFSKISNSMIYTIKVRPYTKFNGKVYYGPWSGKAYLFTQPQLKSAKVPAKGKLKNKLYLKWNKVAGATSYKIFVSTKPKSGYKAVKTVGAKTLATSVAKLNGKKFNPKTRYYVYVQTQKKVGKKLYNSGRLYYWNTKNNNALGYF